MAKDMDRIGNFSQLTKKYSPSAFDSRVAVKIKGMHTASKSIGRAIARADGASARRKSVETRGRGSPGMLPIAGTGHDWFVRCD
jgi:hypothetical protein